MGSVRGAGISVTLAGRSRTIHLNLPARPDGRIARPDPQRQRTSGIDGPTRRIDGSTDQRIEGRRIGATDRDTDGAKSWWADRPLSQAQYRENRNIQSHIYLHIKSDIENENTLNHYNGKKNTALHHPRYISRHGKTVAAERPYHDMDCVRQITLHSK